MDVVRSRLFAQAKAHPSNPAPASARFNTSSGRTASAAGRPTPAERFSGVAQAKPNAASRFMTKPTATHTRPVSSRTQAASAPADRFRPRPEEPANSTDRFQTSRKRRPPPVAEPTAGMRDRWSRMVPDPTLDEVIVDSEGQQPSPRTTTDLPATEKAADEHKGRYTLRNTQCEYESGSTRMKPGGLAHRLERMLARGEAADAILDEPPVQLRLVGHRCHDRIQILLCTDEKMDYVDVVIPNHAEWGTVLDAVPPGSTLQVVNCCVNSG